MAGSCYYWEVCTGLNKSNVANLIVHVAMVEDSLSFDFAHTTRRQSAEAAVWQEVFFDGFDLQGKVGRDKRVGSEERVQVELVLEVGWVQMKVCSFSYYLLVLVIILRYTLLPNNFHQYIKEYFEFLQNFLEIIVSIKEI
jgi:hypothetical protein